MFSQFRFDLTTQQLCSSGRLGLGIPGRVVMVPVELHQFQGEHQVLQPLGEIFELPDELVHAPVPAKQIGVAYSVRLTMD